MPDRWAVGCWPVRRSVGGGVLAGAGSVGGGVLAGAGSVGGGVLAGAGSVGGGVLAGAASVAGGVLAAVGSVAGGVLAAVGSVAGGTAGPTSAKAAPAAIIRPSRSAMVANRTRRASDLANRDSLVVPPTMIINLRSISEPVTQ